MADQHFTPDEKSNWRIKHANPEIGCRFGKLTVTGPFRTARYKLAMCVCDCGKPYEAKISFLVRGVSKSCGCSAGAKKHGHTANNKRSRAHSIWTGMLSRCNPANTGRPDWKRYGGKGIRVCDRWMKFESFLADMGEPPEGMSLDRYPDTKGNYEPSNCRWASAKAQANNTSKNRIITHNGETMTAAQWSERLGIPYSRMYYRLYIAKWPVESALTEPLQTNQFR